ncbi:MAG: hypothetical protein KAS29_18235 [Bacteroidales bacterium]|nr:hypothetical protein [Bacteroidales bacterium]
MKLQVFLLLGLAGIISSCQKETDSLIEEEVLIANEESALKSARSGNSTVLNFQWLQDIQSDC